MWLDRNELNRFFSETEGDIELLSVDRDYHEDEYPIIKCWRCKDIIMKKINFLDYSKIILDYCPECKGLWLDKGELDKIKNYMNNIETESHEVQYRSAYGLLIKLSELSYYIFR